MINTKSEILNPKRNHKSQITNHKFQKENIFGVYDLEFKI